jgi:hypothetical protein
MKERKLSKNQIAEIRARLMQDGTVFNCFGEQWKVSKSTSSVGDIHAIYRNDIFGKGMNVNKFGPTCVTLYTYDMLGNKTVGKFRYDLIEFENKEA